MNVATPVSACEKLENVEIILVPTAADLKYPDSDVPAPKIINTDLKEYLEPFLEDLTVDDGSTIDTNTTNTTNTESTVEPTE